jgi:hypothetical protein
MEKWIFVRKRIVSDIAAIGKREAINACLFKNVTISFRNELIESAVFGGQFVGPYFCTCLFK